MGQGHCCSFYTLLLPAEYVFVLEVLREFLGKISHDPIFRKSRNSARYLLYLPIGSL